MTEGVFFSLPLAGAPQLSSKLLQSATRIIAAAALVAILYFGRDFFVTLIVSALFAFILDPAVLLVMKLRLPRGAATPIVIGVAFALIYCVGVLLWSQVATLRDDLPTYTSRISEIVDKTNTQLDGLEQRMLAVLVPQTLRQHEEQIQEKPKQAMKARNRRSPTGALPAATAPEPPAIQEVRIHQDPKPILATLYAYVSRYFHFLIMVSFVPFLIYFMLSWRDLVSQRFLGLFPSAERYSVEQACILVGENTRGYVAGNFFLWLFLGSVSAATFFFLGVPYWPLIGVLSATFSLLPYVGLPLSIMPPALATLAIPNKFKIVLLAIVLTGMLHVVTMNFIYAKVVGGRVRLNPLVVTVALMFWGTIWGGVGLILAVPITAAIKAVCDNTESLAPYGKLLGD